MNAHTTSVATCPTPRKDAYPTLPLAAKAAKAARATHRHHNRAEVVAATYLCACGAWHSTHSTQENPVGTLRNGIQVQAGAGVAKAKAASALAAWNA